MATHSFRRARVIYTIAVIGFIYILHSVIPLYSNSSFLALFADERTIGFIYMAGSAVSIFFYLIAPDVIRRLGNYTCALLSVCIQIALFYGLVAAHSPLVLAVLFILQFGMNSIIGLTLDIFLEGYTDVATVGTIRGFYNAALNASFVVAPLIGTMLIGVNNFRNTYVAALAMLFPLLYLIYRNFPRFPDPNYTHLSPWHLIKHVYHNVNWVRLMFASFILQTFYSWMVVYSPIYLNKTLGFSWEEIGIIIVIMLLPFPLVQYPLGRMADKKYGEKEIMAIGLAIMGFSTMALSFFTEKNVLLWAVLFFITRIGAASAEIMIETYFFKTVPPRDAAVLGIFRITRPLSYFIAPLITLVGLYFTSSQYLFIIVGCVVLIGLIPALTIKDTK